MSVMNTEKVKVILPRSGPDEFWSQVQRSYAGEDQKKWKYLAMLSLRVNGGWPLDCIGRAFGHPKGHVTRCLSQIRDELQARFEPSPHAEGAGAGAEGEESSGHTAATVRHALDWPLDTQP